MPARQIILKLAMVFFAGGLLVISGVDAAVYKWKDESGMTHFTDDPTKVPETFRDKPFIKDSYPSRKTSDPGKKVVPDGKKETSGEKNIVKEPAETVKQASEEGLTEAQRSSAEAAVNFLREDVVRYETIYTWPASRTKFRLLKETVAGATPKKQALLEQITPHDLPLFQEIAGFLQASIAEDEQAQKVLPTTITSTRQTQALMNRLKKEAEQENQFLKKLTAILSSKN